MMELDKVAAKYADYVIGLRRHLHENPELSGEEDKTREFICAELDKLGIPWRRCGTEGNGVIGTLEGAKPGKTILLRADFDALPIEEQTELPFSSKNAGCMHACGHDAHTASLLTAAAILRDMKDELPGTVKFAFQAAEEIGAGAKWMLGDGVLEGVDGCFAMHVSGEIPAGQCVCGNGPRWAAAREFIIKVHGKGGHGAQPQDCVDAVVIGSAIVQAFQTIVSRRYAPADPVVVTAGSFHAGNMYNVIAGEAELIGTTRCFDPAINDELPVVMKRMAEDIADMYGGSIEFIDNPIVMPVVNNPAVAAIARDAACEVLGEGSVVEAERTMIGEDFSYFVNKVPGAMMRIGIRNEECGAIYAIHHNKFTVDESVLIKAAMIHAEVVLKHNEI